MMICIMSIVQILKELHMSSHSFPGNPMENQKPIRVYLLNLGTIDLSISASIFTTCSLKTSRRSWTNIVAKRKKPNRSLTTPEWSKSMNKSMKRQMMTLTNLRHIRKIFFPEESYPMKESYIDDLLEIHTPSTVNLASIYHISKHSASSYGTLVGRRSNGV